MSRQTTLRPFGASPPQSLYQRSSPQRVYASSAGGVDNDAVILRTVDRSWRSSLAGRAARLSVGYDPLAKPSGNARNLRFASLHRDEFERRQRVETGNSD